MLLLALLFSATCALGQSSILRELSIGSTSGASVNVTLDDRAASALANIPYNPKITGYRICIFSDNSQTARGAAGAAISQLNTSYGAIDANVVWQNPFFKVYAGHCLSKIEAAVLLGRLKYIFPAAFIVSEQMPISVFAADATEIVEPNDAQSSQSSEGVN